MDKFKKIDKEFLITDSSLNSYKYRLLTSGYQLADFKKNPIGFYMHGTPEFPREVGVLVKWDDLRADGDKVYGKPSINMNHPRGQRTVDEIENGFLNAASVGKIVALTISTNPDDYLDGQEGPTLSKWFNRECSLCDIPGNYNALTDLVDENDTPLNLSDYSPQKLKMKQIFFTPAQLSLMNLKADAEQPAVETAFADLIAKAGKVDTLTADLAAANQKAVDAEKKLADQNKAANDKAVKDLVDKAVGETRCTKEAGELLKTQFAEKPTELQNLLATMKPYMAITKSLGGSTVADLSAMSWEELDAAGKLEDLKAKDFETFKTKFSEAHNGAQYKG